MRWMLLAALLGGCGTRELPYDVRASAAYRAAWEKKVAGDEAGYRAALAELKKQFPGTRAGDRAGERLEAKKQVASETPSAR